MATQELIKSIEAKKLNKRSKLPLPEPPVTIPYGGLVQDLEADGETVVDDPLRQVGGIESPLSGGEEDHALLGEMFVRDQLA